MIQSWTEYLAFLSWQNNYLCLNDFKNVFLNEKTIYSVDNIIKYISHPEAKNYLRTNKDWWKQVEQDKKTCALSNIKTLWPFHPNYPDSLFHLTKPPFLISWKGESCWENNFLFSVVGSRKPYKETLLWMDMHLGTFLKNKNICLMSGGARGVDQKAHALSLAALKPTLCFLPCGIQNYYPSDLYKWEKHIIEGGGALISVFPHFAPMQKSYFHVRNKILSYLSNLILIAQAQLRSGTMVTANYALNAGTTLSVLPGSPIYAGYKGNLSLINDGCFMVRDYLDLETLYHSCLLNKPKEKILYKQILESTHLQNEYNFF